MSAFAHHKLVSFPGVGIIGPTRSNTLAGWGATRCVCHQTSQGLDRMELTLDTVSAYPTFARLQPVDLYAPNGQRVFRGWRKKATGNLSGSKETTTYDFDGPWQHFLDTQTFFQVRNFAENPAANILNLLTGNTSEVDLCWDLVNGLPVDPKTQIQAALDQAKSACGNQFTYDLSKFPSGLQFPSTRLENKTCGEIVKAMLRYCPELTCRWDFSPSVPKLVFGNPMNRDLQRTAGGLLVGSEQLDLTTVPSWAPGLRLCGELHFTDRADMLTGSYTIHYVQEWDVSDINGQVEKWEQVTDDVATVANGSNVNLQVNVRLRGPTWDGTTYSPPEPVPSGLAALMLREFSRPQYEFEFETVAADCDWVHSPGSLWSVLGTSDPGMASAASILQTVTRDIGTGKVSYKTGPLAHLDMDSLLALRIPWWARQVPRPGSSKYGFGQPDKKPDGANDANTKIVATKYDPGTGDVTQELFSLKATSEAAYSP